VTKFHSSDASALLKPRTAATAATHFAGFLCDATFGTYGADSHLHGGCYMHAFNKNVKRTALSQSLKQGASTRKLTCANSRAFDPTVLNVLVVSTSAIPKPSTTRSATTGSAGFHKRAALWTRLRTSDCWRDDCRVDDHVGYQLAVRQCSLPCYILTCS